MKAIVHIALTLTAMLLAKTATASSPGGGWVIGEQYATETIYARTCGIDPAKIDRFEKGIPLLLLHMKMSQESIIEALDTFYRVKHDETKIEKIKAYKATTEGCGQLKGRIESALSEMDKHSILLNQKIISKE
jgi:hypothetical protein